MNKLFFAWFAILAIDSAHAQTPPPVYAKLSERRPSIVFPNYTAEEKLRVAKTAQIFFHDFYVNRERKISFYGPQVDPLPGVAQIVADAPLMSDENFHMKLEELFVNQHDFHLGYTLPKPYSCYRSLLPFSLAEAIDANGQKVIAVKSLAVKEEIFQVVPEARRISVGDVLISYDGKPTRDAVAALAPVSRGSNEFGSVRSAIQSLTTRSHGWRKVPENDVVQLTFRSRQGEQYSMNLPWVSFANLSCLGFNTQTPSRTPKNTAVNEDQVEFEKEFKPHQRNSETDFLLTDTPEPILHYDVIQNEFGKFGWIRLDSFVPEKLSIDETVNFVRGLLEKELAGTDGLILDLRDNGGGQIDLAESLAELFTPSNIQALKFRLLNSKMNNDLFQTITSWSDGYREALQEAQTIGANYTKGLSLASTKKINSRGQAYFKPVAVLTNSSCYSSCDMLTSSMQDQAGATIWGEDGRTGGGGANNVSLSYFLQALPANHTLPLFELPGGQSIGTAWRQTIRVGKHAGELIEEAGISADKIAAPTLADFFSSGSQQIRMITANLIEQSRDRRSWYKFDNHARLDIVQGAPVELKTTVSDTRAIEVRIDGRSLSYDVVDAPASSQGTVVHVPVTGLTADVGSIELIGYEAGERAWRARQTYRVVPATSTLLNDSNKLVFDFNSADLGALKVYTYDSDASQGWSVQNGKLKAGLGDNYPDNLSTEAALFVDLRTRTQAAKVSFDVEGATEEGYDFFNVVVVADGKETNLMPAMSGHIAAQRLSFDLTPYLGKQIEIRFTFNSDPGVTDRGVNIGHLVVE